MCDARSFGEGDAKAMIPANLVFLTEESAAEYRASLWRGMDIVDNLHCGTIRHGTSVVIHISMLGRKHIVDFELFGLYNNGKLTEYVIAERLLPPDYVVPRDLQRRYSLTTTYLLRDCSSNVSDEGADDAPPVANPEEPPREFKWQLPAKRRSSWVFIEDSKEQAIKEADSSSGSFSCLGCRTKNTTQRRCEMSQ